MSVSLGKYLLPRKNKGKIKKIFPVNAARLCAEIRRRQDQIFARNVSKGSGNHT